MAAQPLPPLCKGRWPKAALPLVKLVQPKAELPKAESQIQARHRRAGGVACLPHTPAETYSMIDQRAIERVN